MFDTLYEDKDMRVRIEWNDAQAFVHLDVWRWAPSVYKKMCVVLAKGKQLAKDAGYKCVFAYNVNHDAKWEKFVQMFQFEFLGKFNNLPFYYLRCE